MTGRHAHGKALTADHSAPLAPPHPRQPTHLHIRLCCLEPDLQGIPLLGQTLHLCLQVLRVKGKRRGVGGQRGHYARVQSKHSAAANKPRNQAARQPGLQGVPLLIQAPTLRLQVLWE